MPKPPFAPAVGPRVRLRLLQEADLPTTLAWRNRDDVRKWFVFNGVLTPEQHAGWFAKNGGRDDDYVFVIEENGPPARPVGQVSLYKIDWAAGACEFGRIIVGEPDAAGRGYAGEATALALDVAFRRWGLREVVLEVFADNARAIRVYEKHGFERTGEANGLVAMRATAAKRAA